MLGVLYESYIHPLTILSTLPSAGVGALLALMITGHDLGVIGIIGIILLIGIVKKNAIMMIDFALDAERDEGKPPREAIHQAALLRFRPILMTTLAALFAALPLMLGWGEGAELRRPLGLAIFGGLIVSQLLTLFTTPVIYLWFDRLGAALRLRRPNLRKGEADPRARRGRSPTAGAGGMNLSAPFVRRPIGTMLLTIGVALAGIARLLRAAGLAAAAGRLPDDLGLGASLPGASPETMATSVATPLERHLGRIAGVTEMTSSSRVGSTHVTLQFDLDRNIDGAARDVQAAINAARVDLPATLRTNPTYRKVNPADAPIIILALTSQTTHAGPDLRRRLQHRAAAAEPGEGRRRRRDRRRARCRRCGSSSTRCALAHYGIGAGGRARRARLGQRQPAEGRDRRRRARLQIYTNDAGAKAADYAPLVVA